MFIFQETEATSMQSRRGQHWLAQEGRLWKQSPEKNSVLKGMVGSQRKARLYFSMDSLMVGKNQIDCGVRTSPSVL